MAKESKDAPLVPWNWVASTSRRESAVGGMILGCALGEAFALPRDRLSRRHAIKIFGVSPLKFQLVPGLGVSGDRTHALLMTIQAVLESRSSHKHFVKRFGSRLFWYRVSCPMRTILRSAQQIFGEREWKKGPLASDPLVRAAALSVLLQGSQNAEVWIESSCKRYSNEPAALAASTLVARASQFAHQFEEHETPESHVEILNVLSATSDDEELSGWLEVARDGLDMGYGVSRVASSLGWSRGVPSDPRAIAVMAIYSWLRHPTRFRFAVERGVMLGGASASVGALAGALSGIALGRRGIPPEWVEKLVMFPHSRDWQIQLIERVKDWPHGVVDIDQSAHAQPSMPLGQLVRNMAYSTFRLINIAIRLPSRMISFEPKSR